MNGNQFSITSSAYAEGGKLPEKYTCDGQEISPPIAFRNVPETARSIAVIFDDPDAVGGTYDHWLVWNIPASASIAEGTVPAGAFQGTNSEGTNGYSSPCPPSGTHRYIFHAYALDTDKLIIPDISRRADLEKAMQGHILAEASLTSTYSKK